MIRDNVAESVKPPPVPDHELPILQPDRARELLEALRGRPFYLIASLALASGMRRNEILGLRWRDVDLDAGRLRVELSLRRPRLTAFGLRHQRRVTVGALFRCRHILLQSCGRTGVPSSNSALR